MKTNYFIELNSEKYSFSAAHFLILDKNVRESLHGHDFIVKVKLESRKLKNDMVLDFLILEKFLIDILKRYDHKVLIPLKNSFIKIICDDNKIEIFGMKDDLFIYPKSDVLLLDISNTTAENLAEKFWSEIYEKINTIEIDLVSLEVTVKEGIGMSATCKKLQ